MTKQNSKTPFYFTELSRQSIPNDLTHRKIIVQIDSTPEENDNFIMEQLSNRFENVVEIINYKDGKIYHIIQYDVIAGSMGGMT